MSTQQTSTNTSNQHDTGAQGEPSIWRQVMGDKAYHRAIRKEHSARYRHPCPWCGFESTTPHTKPGSQAPATRRLCGNCQFIFPARTGAREPALPEATV
jgi:hypothetical protein